MPVSRKRKKKPRKSKFAQARPRAGFDAGARSSLAFGNPLADLAAHRRHVFERRTELATAAAEALVAELVALAPDRLDCDLEDELCTRAGPSQAEWDEGPLEHNVPPSLFAEALVVAATAAVRSALRDLTTEPDGWQAPWRVLTVVAGLVPLPLSETIAEVIDDLRAAPGGRVLPEMASGPAVTGQVLWTRDAYGSRFGVTAAISTSNGPQRWYLWDIDACGHQAFTVHSAYYQSAEQVLAAWQSGVGEVAAAGTAFCPVDDRRLLVAIMPAEEGFMRSGGESVEQFVEYHRCRRLAEAAMEAVARLPEVPRADLNKVTAATEFTAWLQAHRADRPQPDDLDEQITELADSWNISGLEAVYSSCSPHRVALTVHHLRGYYEEDFATELIALLPDWTCWLAERNGMTPQLAERCQPYALGKTHADVGDDDSRPKYQARVVE